MKYTVIENEMLQEKSYIFTHDTGLKIILAPKKGFSKSCAFFGVNFGSTTNCFKKHTDAEYITIPDGVAHFLEHKLFESEDGDAFTKYAKTGASANAYTSFTSTAYYFSCTDKLKENIKILTDLMQTPYFTAENVNKEQGIIGQEINMYLDNPGWRVYFNLLEAMYSEHPVRNDIAGSVESIAKISSELLYDCYNKFYSPSNMALSICGDFDVMDMAEYVSGLIKKLGTGGEMDRYPVDEPLKVGKRCTEQTLSVSMPLFNIGFKGTDGYLSGEQMLKKDLIGRMTLDMLFGKSSSFFNENYNAGLINDNFDIEFECEAEYNHSIISGESNDPEKVYEKVLEKIKDRNITDEIFERQLNIEKSLFISGLNSVEGIARDMMNAQFDKINYYSTIDVINSITKQDIEEQCHSLKKDLSVLSVIKPQNN